LLAAGEEDVGAFGDKALAAPRPMPAVPPVMRVNFRLLLITRSGKNRVDLWGNVASFAGFRREETDVWLASSTCTKTRSCPP